MLRAYVLALCADMLLPGGLRWNHVRTHPRPHVPQHRRPGSSRQSWKTSRPEIRGYKFQFIPNSNFIQLISFNLISAKILPVVKNHHLLLCTLLIGNALAMEVLLN